ncbi:MAG: hypothetical protein HQK53_02450 [Oligoflexia bacterium]|nr:hypothetical protein [Oligoflexia bacterium]
MPSVSICLLLATLTLFSTSSFLGAFASSGSRSPSSSSSSSSSSDSLESSTQDRDALQQLMKVLFDRRLVVSSACRDNQNLNFGVIVANPYFKIYRSSALGNLGVADLEMHLQNPNDLPRTIVYLNRCGYQNDDPLIVAKERGIQLFKGLSNKPHYMAGNYAEEEKNNNFFPRSRIVYNFIHPHGTSGYAGYNVYLSEHNPLHDLLVAYDFGERDKGIRGGRDGLYNVLERILLGQVDGPVLFHCKGGIHRTGMAALAIRYLQGNAWIAPFAAVKLHAKRDKFFPRCKILQNMSTLLITLYNFVLKIFRQSPNLVMTIDLDVFVRPLLLI